MKLSARTVLKGKVAGREPGAAARILGLAFGDEAFAVIQASDVLVGKP